MLPPATWYPDPSGRHEHRYWDGEQWTEHVADAGIASVDELPVVTADDQVNGGMAADIAAVAMAAMSTDDAPDAATGLDDQRWRMSRGQRRRRPDTGPRHDPLHDGPSGDSDDDGDDAPGDAPIDDQELWREAAAMGFVMPSDAVRSRSDATAADAVAARFVGADLDGTDVGAAHSVATVEGGVTVGVRLDGPVVVAATRAVRRIVGTCDLEPADPRWTRRVIGDGSVSLVADDHCTVVAVPGVDRVIVRSDAFVGCDGLVTVVGADLPPASHAIDAIEVADANWLAVTAPAGPTVVAVEGDRRLAAGHLVAWTDGLEAVPAPGGFVLLRGHGSVLIDGALPD